MNPSKKTQTKNEPSEKKPEDSKSLKAEKNDEKSKNDPKMKNNTQKNTKMNVISRNLLRLYYFISENKTFEQEELLKELQMDTPNEDLLNEIERLKLELEAIHEENHALRQSALQNQVEVEEQISAYKIEIEELQSQLEQVDDDVKEKIKHLTEKYEKRITKLEKDLQESVIQNEKFTKVNEAVQMLQEKAKSLFSENDRLEKENRELTSTINQHEEKIAKQKNEIDKILKKKQELEKKVELQNMVIDGYKRKEK